MAGNATDARKQAERKLDDAKRTGASREDIAKLQAEYDAARADELRQTGQNEQARSIL